MSCCGRGKIDPNTGQRRIADGNGGKGWEYVAPDGTRTKFATKHLANVERVRQGGGGSVQPVK